MKKIISIIIIISIISMTWTIGPREVRASGFSYSRSITIDHTKVGAINNTDQSNFPVLVSLSNTTLKDTSHGGHVANSNGYDIYFYSDAALTTRLPAERESYDATNGVLVAWVKVGTLSHSSDTVIYMGYGDPSISTDPNSDGTYGKTSVWDANYKGVWHLPQIGLSVNANDSTGANNGSVVGGGTSAGTGKIDGDVDITSSGTNYVNIPSNSSLNVSSLTLEGWVKPLSVESGNLVIATKMNGYGTTSPYWLDVSSDYVDGLIHAGALDYSLTSDNPITEDAWHHVVLTFTGNILNLYVDGIVATSPITIGNDISTNAGPIKFGRDDWGDSFTGSLDEMRLSDSNRSADWINTEYNNQNNPGNIGSSGFYTVGGEQHTSSGTTMTSASFIILNPMIGTGGADYSTSASFKMLGAGNTLFSGVNSSATSFIGHYGFLYYPYVTIGALTATPVGSNVNLSWVASTAGQGWSVSGYNTGIATVSGGPYTYTSVGNTTSHSYSGLTPGNYCFVVQTLDALGNVIGTLSNESCVTVVGGLSFSISDNSINFGALSTSGPRYANTTTGSATDVTAHTMSASSSSGYVITYKGTTLTSGSNTIAVASSVSGDGSAGTAQFGISLGTTGSATIPAAYSESPFGSTRSFVDNVATTIASTSGPTSSETFDVHYLANISPITPAGTYTTAITYIMTGTF
jgi:hypothetical protein